jgi:hypothetical protein
MMLSVLDTHNQEIEKNKQTYADYEDEQDNLDARHGHSLAEPRVKGAVTFSKLTRWTYISRVKNTYKK